MDINTIISEFILECMCSVSELTDIQKLEELAKSTKESIESV